MNSSPRERIRPIRDVAAAWDLSDNEALRMADRNRLPHIRFEPRPTSSFALTPPSDATPTLRSLDRSLTGRGGAWTSGKERPDEPNGSVET